MKHEKKIFVQLEVNNLTSSLGNGNYYIAESQPGSLPSCHVIKKKLKYILVSCFVANLTCYTF